MLVGSSPPHENDMAAIRELSGEFRDKGGVVSAIDLTRRMHEEYEYKMHVWLYGEPPEEISPLPDFYVQVRDSYKDIAGSGGGEMAALGSETVIDHQIL